MTDPDTEADQGQPSQDEIDDPESGWNQEFASEVGESDSDSEVGESDSDSEVGESDSD